LAKTVWIKLFERTNIAAAAAVHVTSEVEKMEIETLGLCTKRFALIPNGVDLPGATPEEIGHVPAGRPFVLSLGRINWKKGLDRLIRAMVHVPGADLVIAGNDEEGYRSRLEEMASGLGGRVRFVGPVYGPGKWELMRSATVFALPSYSENFGIAVLEAMACGVPVVVTPEVGLASAINEAGAGIVVEGEPEKLGAELSRLLADPARCRLMGTAGRKAAEEKFSWGAIAEEMEAVYRSVIAGAGHEGRRHG
jgi:glycosyltransferase involved in cell wall biosynthesis